LPSLLFRIATVVVTAGGSVPTLLELDDPSWLPAVLITVVLLAAAVVVTLDIRSWLADQPNTFSSDEEIRDFMFDWISQDGRVSIFTRDMSWAQQEGRIGELLTAKAEHGELTICLPRRIPLTDHLETHGAHVYIYRELDYAPVSRFTVVRAGRDDAEVAIGRRLHGVHTISTYSRGTHSAFALAEDLLAIVERINA
jgi:hypothetical protein